ncbi:MAG: hypothetical protein B7X28_08370 [Halothiobacillus sp. 13-55-253]|nr:MAG: hypothetical protein B7X28_08370 [Halothiobacillus sp. 13-55-253]
MQRQPGQNQTDDHQANKVCQCNSRAPPQQEQNHQHGGEQGGKRRGNDAQIRIFEAIDVGTNSAQQIPALIILKASRCQWFQTFEEPLTQAGEEPECGLMGDQSFEISAHGTQNCQTAWR